MPSILGDRFNLEMAIRFVVLLGAAALVILGAAIAVGRLLQRRRRERQAVEALAAASPGVRPSHGALVKFCEDHLIDASWRELKGRGTAAAVFARDDARHWHALLDVLAARAIVDHGRLRDPR